MVHWRWNSRSNGDIRHVCKLRPIVQFHSNRKGQNFETRILKRKSKRKHWQVPPAIEFTTGFSRTVTDFLVKIQPRNWKCKCSDKHDSAPVRFHSQPASDPELIDVWYLLAQSLFLHYTISRFFTTLFSWLFHFKAGKNSKHSLSIDRTSTCLLPQSFTRATKSFPIFPFLTDAEWKTVFTSHCLVK